MYNSYSNRNEEKPPYSRIFVVCSKQAEEQELKEVFQKYGDIEDIYMPRDRATKELKGVAYIKFTKTSAAASAIQERHMKPLKPNQKPLKVMIAVHKNDTGPMNEQKYTRLFIKVNREQEEKEIVDHFSKFGYVQSVHLQKDKATGISKGFAYVHYSNFLDAAKAYEECDKKYKPVFATPKDELKRSRNSMDMSLPYDSPHNHNYHNVSRDMIEYKNKGDALNFGTNSLECSYDTIVATCSPQVPQKHIERLFNIVPGMQQCQYTVDTYNGFCKSVITYDSEKAAAYAYEKINNFEFPSGEIVSIKPDNNPLNKVANNLANIVNSFKSSIDAGNPNLLQLADAIAQTSSLIKAATFKTDQKINNVDESYGIQLPPPQPIANSNSRVAQRCFIVCKPYPPPLGVLRDLFCRFGDLIDVCTFPNKTFGFVKYGTMKAAQDAMATLNGVVIHGTHFKVLEADERPSKDDDHKMSIDDSADNFSDHGNGSKRIKLQDD